MLILEQLASRSLIDGFQAVLTLTPTVWLMSCWSRLSVGHTCRISTCHCCDRMCLTLSPSATSWGLDSTFIWWVDDSIELHVWHEDCWRQLAVIGWKITFCLHGVADVWQKLWFMLKTVIGHLLQNFFFFKASQILGKIVSSPYYILIANGPIAFGAYADRRVWVECPCLFSCWPYIWCKC